MATENVLAPPYFGEGTWGFELPFFGESDADEEEADYSPIYDGVRALLQQSATALPDTDPLMSGEVALQVAQRLAANPCLGDYQDITGQDKAYFDGALARFVAAAIRPALVVGGTIGGGVIVAEKFGDDEIRYASPQQTLQQPNAPNLEQTWIAQGERFFALITCVLEAATAAGPPLTVVGAAGPHRARAAALGIDISPRTNPHGYRYRRGCW